MNYRFDKINGYYIDENEVSYNTIGEYIQSGFLGFCGCGNIEENLIFIKKQLEKIENGLLNIENPYDIFFLYWADKEEFTEHGGSIFSSWLTEKGKDLITEINKIL